MFGHYFKITLRKLYREKLYAAINIAGLSIAIACCVILGLYLRSELTYDQYHKNYERIFRIEREFNNNGVISRYAVTAFPMGPMLAEEYPVIEDYARLRNEYQEMEFRHEDQVHYWENVFTATDNIFRFFTHDIIHGDPDTALVDPNGVAVSETFAHAYFGEANPIGKIISTDVSGPRTITLVFADLPHNSHVRYDVLFSYNHESVRLPDNPMERARQLGGGWDYTYLLMPEGFKPEDYTTINDSFFQKYLEQSGATAAEGFSIRTWLTPLADLHLDSTDLQYDEPGGNILYIYGFTAVAVFILLVACINYINLATARAAKRAREVGMHKILGAGRRQLMTQFLGESMLFAVVALLLGIALVEVVLDSPAVTALLGTPLQLNLFDEPPLLALLAGLCLLIGLLSGIYPAIYLSSMAPLSAMIGKTETGKTNIRLREALVLVQFTVTVAVIACTLLMAAQMRYISNKALGFKKENQVMVRVRGLDLIDRIPVIRDELLRHEQILDVTWSPSIMGLDFPQNGGQMETNDGEMQLVLFHGMVVADNFLEAMDMELIEGRSFSGRLPADGQAGYIVNETLVRNMGWDEPLGKRIQTAFDGRVIGVMKDFHFRSLHETVGSFLFISMPSSQRIPADNRPNPTRLVIIKIAGHDVPGTLRYIEDRFTAFDPAHPFEYRFLDDTLNMHYQSDQRLMKLTGVFAGICIFIACLGLFGLAAFTTEQRTKEIGIRKVLGATTAQIILMLSKGILILVLIGAAVASLLAWYAMDEWLAGFAYRTDINPLVFLLSATLAAAVAFITLALQSYKTARSNPVQALRYE